MEEFCESVGAPFFYGCLWECVLASPAVRLQAINYVIVHYNKRQTMEDQLFFMGTNIDVLVSFFLNPKNILQQLQYHFHHINYILLDIVGN